MAGYFRKLVGRVYDGAHVAAEKLTNGLFVGLNAEGKVVKLAAADADTKLRCVEKTELWGKSALVLDVVSVGAEAYMVENDFPVTEHSAYDEVDYEIGEGEFVKMKRPLEGEQIVITVSDEIYAAASVNGMFTLAEGGVIAAAVADDSTDA